MPASVYGLPGQVPQGAPYAAAGMTQFLAAMQAKAADLAAAGRGGPRMPMNMPGMPPNMASGAPQAYPRGQGPRGMQGRPGQMGGFPPQGARGPMPGAPNNGAPTPQAQLVNASEGQQKQILGEALFPKISVVQPELAGKITGMLLEMDNQELVAL